MQRLVAEGRSSSAAANSSSTATTPTSATATRPSISERIESQTREYEAREAPPQTPTMERLRNRELSHSMRRGEGTTPLSADSPQSNNSQSGSQVSNFVLHHTRRLQREAQLRGEAIPPAPRPRLAEREGWAAVDFPSRRSNNADNPVDGGQTPSTHRPRIAERDGWTAVDFPSRSSATRRSNDDENRGEGGEPPRSRPRIFLERWFEDMNGEHQAEESNGNADASSMRERVRNFGFGEERTSTADHEDPSSTPFHRRVNMLSASNSNLLDAAAVSGRVTRFCTYSTRFSYWNFWWNLYKYWFPWACRTFFFGL